MHWKGRFFISQRTINLKFTPMAIHSHIHRWNSLSKIGVLLQFLRRITTKGTLKHWAVQCKWCRYFCNWVCDPSAISPHLSWSYPPNRTGKYKYYILFLYTSGPLQVRSRNIPPDEVRRGLFSGARCQGPGATLPIGPPKSSSGMCFKGPSWPGTGWLRPWWATFDPRQLTPDIWPPIYFVYIHYIQSVIPMIVWSTVLN